MFKLLEQLRLERSDELPIVVQEAVDIHTQRHEKLPLSRTSLFYACLQRSVAVRSMVARQGFSMDSYEKSIGLHLPPPLTVIVAEPVEVDVSPEIRGALERHADEWRHHPVDAIWLAAAILDAPNFVFLEHLLRAGMSQAAIRAAADRLSAIIVPPRADASIDAWSEAPWHPDEIRPYAAITKFFLFDEDVNGLLAQTVLTTRELPSESPVVTTSLLLISALTRTSATGTDLEWLQKRARSGVTPEEFQLRMNEWLRWYRRPMPFPVRREQAFVTNAMIGLLRDATRLASETIGEATIHERHFVAALLNLPLETGVHRFLNFINSNVESLRREFLWRIEENRALRDEREPWRTFLGSNGRDIPDDGTITAPAAYVDDQRRLADQLGFRRDANAFAALICAKSVQPPLSIGIFGDWGSGKSFFMDMMYDAITYNAMASKAKTAPHFHPKVLQVRFNAWHYTEANLWASLVEHIFGHILEFLHPDDSTDKKVREQRDQLMQTIDAITAEKLRLQRDADVAKLARDHAVKEVDAERARSESSAAMVHLLVATSAWENATIDDDVKADFHVALENAGVDRVIETASDLREAVNDLSSVGSRVGIFWSWLLTGRFAWLRMLTLVAVFGLPLVVSEMAEGTYPRLDAFSTKLSAYFAALAAWLTPMVLLGRRVMTQLDNARKKVEKVFSDAEKERLQGLVEARKKQKIAEAALEQAADALSTAEQNLNVAQTKLAELSDDRRLARFVQERAASDDYRKLLGVVATIRKDFESLMKLMTLSGKDASLRVDRIVLYVDDLDRCPPERVEQVLQAVHLLLAFKLFVVVVGVDARWVSRSLSIRHPMLAENTVANEQGLPGHGARPEDYLEKIFQIPFWVPRMNKISSANLIDSLLAPPPVVDAMQVAASTEALIVPVEPAQLTSDSEKRSPETFAPALQTDTEQPEAALSLDPVAITPHERAYLHTVAGLAGRSPRAVKRFVNVYRLIRSSIAAMEIASFIDEQHGEFRSTLVLLATVVGVPSIAVEFLRHIERLDGASTLEELALTIRPGNEERSVTAAEWHRLQCHLSEIGAMSKTISVGDLRRQIRRVGRFTFEYGRF